MLEGIISAFHRIPNPERAKPLERGRSYLKNISAISFLLFLSSHPCPSLIGPTTTYRGYSRWIVPFPWARRACRLAPEMTDNPIVELPYPFDLQKHPFSLVRRNPHLRASFPSFLLLLPHYSSSVFFPFTKQTTLTTN